MEIYDTTIWSAKFSLSSLWPLSLFLSSRSQSLKMRTRFLDIDYFAPENESFHCLPVPHLVSKPLSSVGDLLHFDFVPEISLAIDRLTIDSALTKFFDDVLPRRIDDDNDYGDACDRSSRLQGSTDTIFSSAITETRLLEVKLFCSINAIRFHFRSWVNVVYFLRLW